MFNPKHLISWATNAQNYIWVEAHLLKETPKAIKILFDGKEIWLPKVWIKVIARSKATKQSQAGPVAIKIFERYWERKI